MAKIQGALTTFLQGAGAQAIDPVPIALPNQRGPSCGFSALSYVLTYWHERFLLRGGDYATTQPLPARTNIHWPKQVPNDKQKRAQDASKGNYTSLRQYGKFNHLTVLGSVFDADHIVKVAKGENSQYAGQFDGLVIDVSGNKLSRTIKALIDVECPVIVPYDVSVDSATEGEPVNEGGEAAHWVAIIGYYRIGNDDYAVFFNWGAFYTAKADAFAISNAQLTSNKYLGMQKFKIKNKNGVVYYSDYSVPKHATSTFEAWDKHSVATTGKGLVLEPVGTMMHNPEFNDPTEGGTKLGKLDEKDGRLRLAVGGLRNRVVAVFRKEDADHIKSILAGI
jgi:hypothetical protein